MRHTNFVIPFAAFLVSSVSHAAAQTVSNGAGKVDFYGGFVVGASSIFQSGTDPFANPFQEYDSDGKLGVLLGFRKHQGNWFYGPEVDLNLAFNNQFPDNNSWQLLNEHWDAHFRAEVGRQFGNLDVFAAGGLAVSNVDYADSLNGPTNGTAAGWTIGIGADYAVSPVLALRFEALHDEYGFNFNDSKYGQWGGNWHENTVRAGAIFKF